MDFRIADTFTDSLARLSGDEQKAVKTTAFDLQLNPASPGMQLHRLDKAKDHNFWSVRVNADIRIIVHRTEASLMLCYVGHHDAAYAWAERRKIERHPTTGAAQLVEMRESVREIVVPRYVEAEQVTEIADTTAGRDARQPQAGRLHSGGEPLFAAIPEWQLLAYGVPPEWMTDVRAATEGTLFDVAEHLPREAAEALLDIATGVMPPLGPAYPPAADAFEHPDAQRRFRVIDNREELERALDAPWEKWTIFLHPAQRHLVERSYGGPARISGSAGTGKTIVALHRAVHLARADLESRVLLTTFSDPLANALHARLRILIGNEPRIAERLEVHSLDAIGQRLYARHFGPPRIASSERIRQLLADAAAATPGHRFTPQFLWSEWKGVVDAWQLQTWDDYRDVKRLGRKTRLPEAQRRVLWTIFESVRSALSVEELVTASGMFTRLADKLAQLPRPIFDHIIVDESQDLGVAGLRFLAALGGNRADGLFFTGDLGQRIFQLPFSWSSLGVDIRGRSSRLRINYRTSHQIRGQADRLLASELSDVDGVTEERSHTISVFNGEPPSIEVLASAEAEIARVAEWIGTREGLRPHEIALFVRSEAEIARARAAAEKAAVPFTILGEQMQTKHDHLSISTMHLAKGLEFRAVAVMACDEEVIPSQTRIEIVSDESDLDEVYDTERHLLYVACTRARDQLLVTGVAPGSEFLEDMRS